MRPLLLLSFVFTLGCADRPSLNEVVLTRLDNSEVLIDQAESALTVIFFLSPECPLCINYTLAMRNLEQRFTSDSIAFYGVYSKEWFSPEEIRNYKLKYSLEFDMLLDDGNKLANTLGATVTPEVFVFNQKGQKIYSGKIDNWVNDLGKKKLDVSESYLENAMTAALEGNPVNPSYTKPIGCLIE